MVSKSSFLIQLKIYVACVKLIIRPVGYANVGERL